MTAAPLALVANCPPDRRAILSGMQPADPRPSPSEPFRRFGAWLDGVDPGTNRRIKGLRLVTAFALAAMAGKVLALSQPGFANLGSVAGGFALWASVSEGRDSRFASSRDLVLLSLAAVIGAASMILLGSELTGPGWPGAELVLVTGAFGVGYLRHFGILGSGIGSQIYIGQVFAYGIGLTLADLPMVAVAGLIAAVSAIVPRVLSGPAEQPEPANSPQPGTWHRAPELRMGLQAGVATLAIVLLKTEINLEHSAWAVTACTYVIAGTAGRTLDRVRRRVAGTLVGVPIGLAFLPLAGAAPLVIWPAAALAIVIYAMALPIRYDIACGAYAFALIVTLATYGETSIDALASRAWETLLGGALGLLTAFIVLPLRGSLNSRNN
jgi:hypothetical protein